MYTNDRTSHTKMNEALTKGLEVTPGKTRKWRQCEACMKERLLDIDETPLHVARDCPQWEHLRQELYRASTNEITKTWLACFWYAGIAPSDQEVYNRNTAP